MIEDIISTFNINMSFNININIQRQEAHGSCEKKCIERFFRLTSTLTSILKSSLSQICSEDETGNFALRQVPASFSSLQCYAEQA